MRKPSPEIPGDFSAISAVMELHFHGLWSILSSRVLVCEADSTSSTDKTMYSQKVVRSLHKGDVGLLWLEFQDTMTILSYWVCLDPIES